LVSVTQPPDKNVGVAIVVLSSRFFSTARYSFPLLFAHTPKA
jgi:hypothetical protein